MTAHLLMLEEQVHRSKALAFSVTTSVHMTTYGRAIMDYWAAEEALLPTESAAHLLDDRSISRHPLLVASPQSRRAQVGDRVRVRSGMGRMVDCTELPHFTEETGHTGTIYAEQSQRGIRDHPFLILFDKPVPTVLTCAGVMPLPARHYALSELEPVI